MRLSLTMVLLILFAAESFGQEKSDAAGKRIPWTTSKIRGTPDPPQPYVVEDVFPDLAFKQPVVLTGAPGTERLFVAEVRWEDLFVSQRPRLPPNPISSST